MPAPSTAASEERHMNDTTMPPPRRFKQPSANPVRSSSSRKTAVNVRDRGLKKGYGLHDWKRLLLKSKDLAQRKGQPLRRDITLAEVKQHNKEYDGWMVLRGRVYNIGPYLHYHPGGVRILKGLLGKDGTALFDKYHRWVNIDGLIGPLMIGVLAKPINSDLAQRQAAGMASPVIPTGTANLPNAPRVPTRPNGKALSSSVLALGGGDDDDDDDEEEEDLFLPPPP